MDDVTVRSMAASDTTSHTPQQWFIPTHTPVPPVPPTSHMPRYSAVVTELDLFDALIGLWIPGLLCVFGIVGNALSLWVLSRDRTGSAALTSLKALAASDLVLLIGAFGQQIIPLMCDLAYSTDSFCLSQGYLQVYFWPVVCTAQTSTIWLTVLISTERYLAICAPLRVGRPGGCTRKVRLAIASIVCASIAFNVPRFFEYRPEQLVVTCHRSVCSAAQSNDVISGLDSAVNLTRVVLSDNRLRHEQVYRYLYNTALYCLVIYAAPLSTVTALNIRLVRVVTHARRNWAALNTNQKRELKATLLPLVIVLVFAVCGTFSLLGFVLDAVYAAVVDYPRWLQVYTAIVNALVILNSAVNFLLMLCFGNKFRRMLRDALHCTRTLHPGLSGGSLVTRHNKAARSRSVSRSLVSSYIETTTL